MGVSWVVLEVVELSGVVFGIVALGVVDGELCGVRVVWCGYGVGFCGVGWLCVYV